MRSSSISSSRTSTAIWSCPTSRGARSTSRPRWCSAMQLLMGALFGILGVLFADPILATLKVVLVDLSQQQARRGGRRAGGRRRLAALLLRRAAAAAAPASAASSPRRRGRSSARAPRRSACCPWGSPAAAGRCAEGEPLRHGEAVFAAFLHPGHRLGEAGEDLVHGEGLRRRRGSRCCRTPCRRRRSAHSRAARRRRGRSARRCRP